VPGLIEALGEVYLDSKWQKCVVHFYRNVFTAVPRGKMRLVAARLRHIASTKWGTRAYMDMEHLDAMERDQEEKPWRRP